jgi:hypothetical protein
MRRGAGSIRRIRLTDRAHSLTAPGTALAMRARGAWGSTARAAMAKDRSTRNAWKRRTPQADVRPRGPGAERPPLHPIHELQATVGNRRTAELFADDGLIASWFRQHAGLSPDAVLRPSADAAHEREADRFAETRGAGADAAEAAGARLHTDPVSALVAATLGARAFAVGRHIAFAPGEYQPHTRGGQQLLAHEVGHVLQQRGPGGAAGGAGSGAASTGFSSAAVQVAAKEAPFKPWAGIVATKSGALMARTAPDPASPPRGKIPRGAEVEVVGGHTSTWLIVNGVSSSGVLIEKGWVLAKYIIPKAAPGPAGPPLPAGGTRSVAMPDDVLPPGIDEVELPEPEPPPQVVQQGLPQGLVMMQNGTRNSITGAHGIGITLPVMTGAAVQAGKAILALPEALKDIGKQAVIDAIIGALRAGQKHAVDALRKRAGSDPTLGAVVTVIDEILGILITIVLAALGIVIGFAEGAWEMIEGLVHMVWTVIALIMDFISGLWSETNRQAFDARVVAILEGLRNLVPAIRKAGADWWDRFQKASIDQGSVMIGELTGKIMVLLASFAIGGAAGAAAKTTVTVPGLALARTTAGGVQLVTTATEVTLAVGTPVAALGLMGGTANMMTSGSGSKSADPAKEAPKEPPQEKPKPKSKAEELRGKAAEVEEYARQAPRGTAAERGTYIQKLGTASQDVCDAVAQSVPGLKRQGAHRLAKSATSPKGEEIDRVFSINGKSVEVEVKYKLPEKPSGAATGGIPDDGYARMVRQARAMITDKGGGVVWSLKNDRTMLSALKAELGAEASKIAWLFGTDELLAYLTKFAK